MSSKSKQFGVSRVRDYDFFLTDADIMKRLKQKSRFHAIERGKSDFLKGKNHHQCPYKDGLYKNEWLYGYDLEQSGLPF